MKKILVTNNTASIRDSSKQIICGDRASKNSRAHGRHNKSSAAVIMSFGVLRHQLVLGTIPSTPCICSFLPQRRTRIVYTTTPPKRLIKQNKRVIETECVLFDHAALLCTRNRTLTMLKVGLRACAADWSTLCLDCARCRPRLWRMTRIETKPRSRQRGP